MESIPSIEVTIKLFAIYQETYQLSELKRQFPPQTPVIEVLNQILSENPQLEPWRAVTRFGINLQFVNGDTHLNDGDEVVLIPPVSGG
jgi:sulfur-carrier protein